MRNLKEIDKVLQEHEARLAVLEGRKKADIKNKVQSWYKPGSTIDKIVDLITNRFFDEPRTIGDIISELKTRDFHLKASDLTLPLRKIVRKDMLRKTKKYTNGSSSKKWLYTKA
jgi:hypothetical protein